jgi:hypothetical protein
MMTDRWGMTSTNLLYTVLFDNKDVGGDGYPMGYKGKGDKVLMRDRGIYLLYRCRELDKTHGFDPLVHPSIWAWFDVNNVDVAKTTK